jgi:hypothetical protein
MSKSFTYYSGPRRTSAWSAPLRQNQTPLLRKKSVQQTFSIPFFSKVFFGQRPNLSLFFVPLADVAKGGDGAKSALRLCVRFFCAFRFGFCAAS